MPQINNCPVPPIKDRRGNAWKQPDPKEFAFDEHNDYVLMNRKQFDELRDFSKSIPPSLYIGKMWRGSDDGQTWFLHWWDDVTVGHTSHYLREIILVD